MHDSFKHTVVLTTFRWATTEVHPLRCHMASGILPDSTTVSPLSILIYDQWDTLEFIPKLCCCVEIYIFEITSTSPAEQWVRACQNSHIWWLHQRETFSALLAICTGNSPVNGEFPAQMPVTRSYDVFFDLRLNKRLSKQSWGWWFDTLKRPLWRHCNETEQLQPAENYWI